MRIDWPELNREAGNNLDGRRVEIEGWFAAPDPGHAHVRFFLTDEPSCCAACLPRDPDRLMAVFPRDPVAATGQRLRLRGMLRRPDRETVFELHDAVIEPANDMAVAPGFTRRAVMAGGLAAGLSAWMPGGTVRAATGDRTAAANLLAGHVTMDLHSHAGTVLMGRKDRPRAFSPLAGPMRDGGMAVVCLAVVADSPATRVEDKHIRAYRTPPPGELYDYIHAAFSRLQDLARAQGLNFVTDRHSLMAANSANPSVIVCSEGGDFLEGRADRVDEACERWHLRHLQLTHYRVNELGDIQTEPPVHGGLTDAGAEVIRRCNRLGVVVDVAHGTYDLVKRAASVTDKPLVLSHTSLNPRPTRFSRTISPDHARVIAETDGVIGIWPPTTIFPDLAALAEGMARMVDVAGIDHVGLGTDMQGLLSPAAIGSYDQLPDLGAALLARGFSGAEILKLLGGNAARVFAATMA